jgi:hypothetical protein
MSLHGRSLLGAIAVGAVAFGAARMVGERPAQIVHIATPVPAPIPTVVTVPITAPQPDVHVTVAAPDHLTEEPVPMKARARVPMIDPTCIAPMIEREGDGVSSCTWDDGMPAISEDGMRIVTWIREGEATVAMAFIDTQTSRIVREERLVAKDEMDEYTVKTKFHARVKARIAELQKELEDGGFRSLIEPSRNAPIEGDPMPRGLLVEHATYEPAVRLVDGSANVQLWRGEFYAEDVYPWRADHDVLTCYPQKTESISPSWDPTTRIVFVEVAYRGTDDTCPLREHHYVRHAQP